MARNSDTHTTRHAAPHLSQNLLGIVVGLMGVFFLCPTANCIDGIAYNASFTLNDVISLLILASLSTSLLVLSCGMLTNRRSVMRFGLAGTLTIIAIFYAMGLINGWL